MSFRSFCLLIHLSVLVAPKMQKVTYAPAPVYIPPERSEALDRVYRDLDDETVKLLNLILPIMCMERDDRSITAIDQILGGDDVDLKVYEQWGYRPLEIAQNVYRLIKLTIIKEQFIYLVRDDKWEVFVEERSYRETPMCRQQILLQSEEPEIPLGQLINGVYRLANPIYGEYVDEIKFWPSVVHKIPCLKIKFGVTETK